MTSHEVLKRESLENISPADILKKEVIDSLVAQGRRPILRAGKLQGKNVIVCIVPPFGTGPDNIVDEDNETGITTFYSRHGELIGKAQCFILKPKDAYLIINCKNAAEKTSKT